MTYPVFYISNICILTQLLLRNITKHNQVFDATALNGNPFKNFPIKLFIPRIYRMVSIPSPLEKDTDVFSNGKASCSI